MTAEIEQDEEDEDSSEAEMKVKDGYQVTANSALSEYLAISMLNGVRKIDLSEFPESSDTVILTDAWEEAYYQNPLILGIDGIYPVSYTHLDVYKRQCYRSRSRHPV